MENTRVKTTTTTTTVINWRNLREYPGYRVSDHGEVQSRWEPGGPAKWRLGTTWRTLKPGRVGHGYARYSLRCGGKAKSHYGHRLVLAAFAGPCSAGMEVLHTNGDCRDNRLVNLRYGTPAENGADRKRHGTSGAGAKNNQAKLTDAKVRQILARVKRGKSRMSIADKFGVTPSLISRIATGKIWGHIAR